MPATESPLPSIPERAAQFWQYKYNRPRDQKLCCGTINRGVAMLGGRIFMTTPDAHLVAIDARNGKQLWDVEMGDWHQGYGSTMAPLVVKDKIIAGVSGGEFGIRGFVDAYDPATGKRVWRFWTIPSKERIRRRQLAGRLLAARRRSNVEHGNIRS